MVRTIPLVLLEYVHVYHGSTSVPTHTWFSGGSLSARVPFSNQKVVTYHGNIISTRVYVYVRTYHGTYGTCTYTYTCTTYERTIMVHMYRYGTGLCALGPTATGTSTRAARPPLAAAEAYAAIKTAKYADQPNFVPFIVETGGYINRRAHLFLKTLLM